jgi:hypothetical protein
MNPLGDAVALGLPHVGGRRADPEPEACFALRTARYPSLLSRWPAKFQPNG